jgi:hypothetical protein
MLRDSLVEDEKAECWRACCSDLEGVEGAAESCSQIVFRATTGHRDNAISNSISTCKHLKVLLRAHHNSASRSVVSEM